MYDEERGFAAEMVAEACRLARRAQADVAAGGSAVAKDDRSPVTVADLAIQAVIAHRLAARFPSDALLAEEESGTIVRAPKLADSVLELARHSEPDLSRDEVMGALDHGRDRSRTRCWVLAGQGTLWRPYRPPGHLQAVPAPHPLPVGLPQRRHRGGNTC